MSTTVEKVELGGDKHSTADVFNTRAGTATEPNMQLVEDELTKDIPYNTTSVPPMEEPTVGEHPVTTTSSMYRNVW